jgi:hypothetical protein
MRASVLSSSALGVVLFAAACVPANARMGFAFHHGAGAHFHGGRDGGHDFGHHDHHEHLTIGGGIDVPYAGVDSPSASAEPFPAPIEQVEYTPAPRPWVSEGPRIIVIDHRKARRPRGPLPIIVYGDPAS